MNFVRPTEKSFLILFSSFDVIFNDFLLPSNALEADSLPKFHLPNKEIYRSKFCIIHIVSNRRYLDDNHFVLISVVSVYYNSY